MRAFYAVFLPVCGLICAQGQGKNWLMGWWKIKFREPMPVRCESSNSSMSFCAYVKYIPPRCPSVRKREWFRQVYRFPDSTECLWALSLPNFARVLVFWPSRLRACACAYIYCVCFQIYMCADPRRLEFLAEVSCAYLVRHAQSAGG